MCVEHFDAIIRALYTCCRPHEPNFNDFTPFGGWTVPTIKQYWDGADGFSCTIGTDVNWMP